MRRPLVICRTAGTRLAASSAVFAANIFDLRDFENDDSKNGSLTLEPAETPLHDRVGAIQGTSRLRHIAPLHAAYAAGG